MNRYEASFKLSDPEFPVIEIAGRFYNRAYQNNGVGYIAALEALREQHRRVLPPTQTLKIFASGRDTTSVPSAAREAKLMLERGDYTKALSATTHLYYFGKEGRYMREGLDTYAASLVAHRSFVEGIQSMVRENLELQNGTKIHYSDLDRARSRESQEEELCALRTILHTAALWDVLGPETKWQFDPTALPAIAGLAPLFPY